MTNAGFAVAASGAAIGGLCWLWGLGPGTLAIVELIADVTSGRSWPGASSAPPRGAAQ